MFCVMTITWAWARVYQLCTISAVKYAEQGLHKSALCSGPCSVPYFVPCGTFHSIDIVLNFQGTNRSHLIVVQVVRAALARNAITLATSLLVFIIHMIIYNNAICFHYSQFSGNYIRILLAKSLILYWIFGWDVSYIVLLLYIFQEKQLQSVVSHANT